MPPKVQIKEKVNDKNIPTGKKIRMNRDKKIEKNEGTPFENYGFFWLISGGVASGKSSLFYSQLCEKRGLLHKKFDKIFLFSPSQNTLPFCLDIEEKYDTFSLDILEDIVNELKLDAKNSEEEYLLILDDCLADIIKTGGTTTFNRTVLNRSHLHLSIVMTTQSFTKVPLILRRNVSHYTQMYTQNKRDLESIFKDILPYPKHAFDQLIRFVFDEKYNFLTVKNTGEIYKNWNKLEIQVDDD